MAGINTSIPGVIVSVDLDSLMASVQPSVNMKFKDGQVQEYPVIANCPVIMPSSSTSAFTFPVKAGDPVIIVFSMRGTDNFKGGNGYPAAPSDFRKFDLSDAFAIPAPWPKSRSVNSPAKHVWDHSPQDAVMVHNLGSGNECEFRLKADGTIQIRTNQDIEAIGRNITVTANQELHFITPSMIVDATTTQWVGDITHIGNITQTGSYTQSGAYTHTGVATFNGVVFSTHSHLPLTTPPY